MIKITAPLMGIVALGAQLVLLIGCGGNNSPTMTGSGSGGATGQSSGGASGTASGGASGTASGGATGTSSGGTTSVGSGGAAGPGSGGSSGGGAYSPLCSAVPVTAAGEAPTKSGACTASDTQLCYKTCGPQSIGFKSETCTGGTYAEQTGCSFDTAMDYSCFKIPTTIDATCPTAIPQAGQACTVAPCVLCNVGGNYLDTSGASKAGYCVCPMPGASGTSKWSCASATAWPCPAGQGC